MNIRRATLADLDAIELLWREMMDFHIAIDDYFIMVPEADTNHREYMTGLLQNEAKCIIVADDNGQIIGYLMAEINDYPPIYLQKQYGHISAISVTASAQREGIGHQLLDAALDWFRGQGVKRVECAVAVENPVSQRFWKGLGFRGIMETHVLEL